MTLELDAVGRTAAELMDELAEQHGDEPNAVVDAVAIIVAVSSDEGSTIRYRCSDRRQWVQRALIAEALELATDGDELERGDTTG